MKYKSFIVNTALFLGALPLAANAANRNLLPDTGQITCYDVAGAVTPCPPAGQPAHGQDAGYEDLKPAYQDNGDGTVTDLDTRLMWQQSDDGTRRTWQAAIDYCNDLDGHHNDWRLPEYLELQSIVNYGRVRPAINPVFTCQSFSYWSATTHPYNTTNAWGVAFPSGDATAYAKTFEYYVRCVRAGQ